MAKEGSSSFSLTEKLIGDGQGESGLGVQMRKNSFYGGGRALCFLFTLLSKQIRGFALVLITWFHLRGYTLLADVLLLHCCSSPLWISCAMLLIICSGAATRFRVTVTGQKLV